MAAIMWVTPEQYETLKRRNPKNLDEFVSIVDLTGEQGFRQTYAILGSVTGSLEVTTALHQAQNPERKPSLKFNLQTPPVTFIDLPPIWWSGEMWNILYRRRGV